MASSAPWRTAWVTGASTGIGRAIALKLAARGVRVVASARSIEKLDELAREHTGIVPVPLDVTMREGVAGAYSKIVALIGPIDLAEEYQVNDRVAVIYRGTSQICDVNLRTGRQSMIGDRLEGIAAFLLVISVPLCFLLIGIPIYYSVRLYSRITTEGLRRRVGAYVDDLRTKLGAPSPSPSLGQ